MFRSIRYDDVQEKVLGNVNAKDTWSQKRGEVDDWIDPAHDFPSSKCSEYQSTWCV